MEVKVIPKNSENSKVSNTFDVGAYIYIYIILANNCKQTHLGSFTHKHNYRKRESVCVKVCSLHAPTYIEKSDHACTVQFLIQRIY